ncbi:hypothetical protein O6H91_20G059900 [Diphasiastrum complanatum]|uniref:Uncharacterized protein n=1 Tax=Diphasiastrum complanatum TaxID=34168 RepID=A0ACC2AQU5_DIPCM|nr:hypothetical protein O6H91_20G059900 [Diphasiastrum complanatum]
MSYRSTFAEGERAAFQALEMEKTEDWDDKRSRMRKRFVDINYGDRNLYPDIYCDNKISNTKYNVINFLPKNLWEQFSRFMNKYFLLIAILQLWPLITPVNPASTWGPLILIFAVSASKEAWDDYNRYKLDKQANERDVWVVKKGNKTRIKAQDIHVGDIVWLREDDEVPCDLVLLGSSDSQGFCFVETAAIDGEIDLKTRVVPPPCIGLPLDLLHKIKGVIECPLPDKDIRRFDANLRLLPPFIDTDYCPLTIDHTLLQSCYLRNTEWACGVAVYTGNETKLGMSKGLPAPKLTAVDGMIDKLTGAIFIFQLVVVLILGIAGDAWKSAEADKIWYVKHSKKAPWFDFFVIPLRFELLCSIMIPISIKVSLDFVKALYAKFIDWDLQMYDEKTDTPTVATNTAISEDLGQVEYILTDKTGTLTENVMIFKRCCIKGVCYGNSTGDALTDSALKRGLTEKNPDIVKFLTVMAVCNTVVPILSSNGAVSYKAQSQDEEALVNAAAQLRVVLLSKRGATSEVKLFGEIKEYEVLDLLEFTSDRKRMSVVIRDSDTRKLMLLSKGADEAIFPVLCSDQPVRAVADAVETYSKLGLRTMCFAWRELKEDEYTKWSFKFKDASSSVIEREWKMAEVCQLMEANLELLGVTAIEDKLQEGVPDTIETLRKAGINFWMLTGDKHATAVQIALSCNFVLPEPAGQLLHVQGSTQQEIAVSLERVLCTMQISSTEPKDVAFVIDGWALEIALKHHYEAFTELATLCRTAICCRVTPSQKAQLVELVKSWEFRTLAIGDGGNDVRMIQEAHVGVGISGREGLQAARASDFSIGKFRFLKRLILVHGRYSYNRTAFLSQYSIYKSLLICFIQIFIPVMVNVLDKDLSESTVLQHPQILYYCQGGRLLNPSTFAGWFGKSLFHATIVFLVTIHVYANEKSEIEELSIVALSGCIWLQAFVIALETNSFTVLQHIAIWGNLLAFYVVNFIVSMVPWGGMYTVMFRICTQPSYWLTMLLITFLGMGPVLALKYFRFIYRPSAINILQQLERSCLTPSSNLSSLESNLKQTDKDLQSPNLVQADVGNVYEPLLGDSASGSKRILGPSSVEFLPSTPQKMLSNYSRSKIQ